MQLSPSNQSTEFSFLAWLERLSMFAVALGIVVAASFGGDDDNFDAEGGSSCE
jgi:hypothetical protein